MGKAFDKFKHRTSQLGVRLATTPIEQLHSSVAKQRSTHTGNASPRHQSRNLFAANTDAFGRKRGMSAWRAVAARDASCATPISAISAACVADHRDGRSFTHA
jgi:hypothetical protein